MHEHKRTPHRAHIEGLVVLIQDERTPLDRHSPHSRPWVRSHRESTATRERRVAGLANYEVRTGGAGPTGSLPSISNSEGSRRSAIGTRSRKSGARLESL